MLGSGTSTGVPRIGNDWGDCDPNEPRNRRTRVSIIVENSLGKRVLIDTSPDLRQQLLANDIDRVDAVLWTHDHADHCHGIDDLRPMRYGRSNALPGYASAATAKRLKARFNYIFAGQYGYPTLVDLSTLDQARLVAGFGLAHCEMPHGGMDSTAFLLEYDGKTVGYATDFNAITPAMVDVLKGADILVSDCLRRDPHPTHAHLDLALELGRKTRAKKLVLTHLDKSMDYATLKSEIPKNVIVGYDGLEIAA